MRLLRALSLFRSLFSAALPCMPGCSIGAAYCLQYLKMRRMYAAAVACVCIFCMSFAHAWYYVCGRVFVMWCCCTHRKLRAEEAVKARLEEEAIMEARRQELLNEEGGYWSRRMAAEQAAAEQLAAAQQALIEVCLCPCSRATSAGCRSIIAGLQLLVMAQLDEMLLGITPKTSCCAAYR